MSALSASSRSRQSSSLSKAQERITIPLATIVSPMEVAAATSLNQTADSTPSVITEYKRYLVRMHSENHSTGGQYNIWCGARNKGTSSTSLGSKLDAAGLKTSVYGHGSYVMQARFEEAGDLERYYPLSAAVFWPGNPSEDRSPQRLMYNSSLGRDELGFEESSAMSWSFRAPGDASSQLVTSSTPGIGTTARTGNQCLAVTRGPSAGQLVASTGIVSGVAKACFPGMKIVASMWVKTQTTARSCGAEIRWMDSSFATISTSAGSVSSDSTEWTERVVSAVAPANAVWFAVQVRWTGPPAANETHYIDDASAIEYASRLSTGIDETSTTLTVHSAQLYRPQDAISSVNVSADTLTRNSHGLTADTVIYLSGNNLPAPLIAHTPYYVRNPTQNTFQLASSAGGAVIDLTTTGAATSYTKAPPTWPFRAPRGSDPSVTASTISASTSSCIHWLRIDDEIMGITAVTGPTEGLIHLTVVRGMWGTTATAHAQDAKVLAPVYIGSISEGADATFAGSPAVNDPTKVLRYALALEQGLDLPQQKRATEWIAKRRAMEILEYDLAANSQSIPQTTNPLAPVPGGWSGYSSAQADNLGGINTLYLDITGTSFYNQADSYGYDVTPWTLVGVPGAGIPPDSMHSMAGLAAAQITKIADLRSCFTSFGFTEPHYIIGNNLATQANLQDPHKMAVVQAGALDLAMLEFWINRPDTQPAKYLAQRDQWMTICADDLKAGVWAKSGQNGLVGTPFDGAPTGAGNISSVDLAHYRRWCYGHFLMGWRGSSNQQFVSEWGLNFKANVEPEFIRFLGKPLHNYDTWNNLPTYSVDVVYREFSLGIVYVNTSANPVTITLPKPLRDLSDEQQPFIQSKVINAYDAGIFFGA